MTGAGDELWNQLNSREVRGLEWTVPSPAGMYRDVIFPARGQIVDLGWRPNIVVDRCRYLLTGFMKGARASGIRFLAVGRGEEGWDREPPPPPQRSHIQLADADPFRLAIRASQIVFLDAAGNATDAPTNWLGITVTLGPRTPPIPGGAASFPLREFGLFGELAGEDYMINYVRHPVIHKRAGETLERTIQLVF